MRRLLPLMLLPLLLWAPRVFAQGGVDTSFLDDVTIDLDAREWTVPDLVNHLRQVIQRERPLGGRPNIIVRPFPDGREPVFTAALTQVTVRKALETILPEVGMTFRVERFGVMITPQ